MEHKILFFIPLLPLLGAIFSLLTGSFLRKTTVAIVSCLSVFVSAVLATSCFWLMQKHNIALLGSFYSGEWFSLGEKSLSIKPGLMMDKLSGVLSLVITWISLLIHIYSTGYMEHDKDFHKFFGYLNLFTFAMLVLVLGDSLPVTFVGWEGVGLCSYLLIGFWHQEDKNASAGKKAFIVNRIGDLGFLMGMFLLFSLVGTLKYSELSAKSILLILQKPLWLNWPAGYFVAVFLFIGAMGKSAQIPLYIWLPDAMAGPTPVSALIHAATMVTAGVYLVARMNGLYDAVVPQMAKVLVASIGAMTALIAATVAIVQKDFKKVLAYSTVSQLGFMFVGVGVGAFTAGIFHLVTHAFFKAGLFLTAGSVMHALLGEGDISKMGGLRKKLPWTHATFLIFCMAISGIFPFAGFFSKDAILSGAYASQVKLTIKAPVWVASFFSIYPKLLWGVLLLAALMTSFYMWRLYFLVFTGSFRGTQEVEKQIHESPFSMIFPLCVLALGSTLIGWIDVPAVMMHHGQRFSDWFGVFFNRTAGRELTHPEEWRLLGIALLVGFLGVYLAFLLYRGGYSSFVRVVHQRFGRLYQVLFNNYYVNEIYDFIFVKPLKKLSFVLWRYFDVGVIDKGSVGGVSALAHSLARALRYVQNGDLQRYIGMALMGGMVALVMFISGGTRQVSQFEPQINGLEVIIQVPMSQSQRLYLVDWDGDGNYDKKTYDSAELTHRYSQPGEYKISLVAVNPLLGLSFPLRWLGAEKHILVKDESSKGSAKGDNR